MSIFPKIMRIAIMNIMCYCDVLILELQILWRYSLLYIVWSVKLNLNSCKNTILSGFCFFQSLNPFNFWSFCKGSGTHTAVRGDRETKLSFLFNKLKVVLIFFPSGFIVLLKPSLSASLHPPFSSRYSKLTLCKNYQHYVKHL